MPPCLSTCRPDALISGTTPRPGTGGGPAPLEVSIVGAAIAGPIGSDGEGVICMADRPTTQERVTDLAWDVAKNAASAAVLYLGAVAGDIIDGNPWLTAVLGLVVLISVFQVVSWRIERIRAGRVRTLARVTLYLALYAALRLADEQVGRLLPKRAATVDLLTAVLSLAAILLTVVVIRLRRIR